MTERHLSRREVALVACALLVPIPVLAASGLGIPLPSAVERAFASLLPFPGSQETSVPTLESGTAAAADGSTGGQPTARGRAAVPDSGDAELPNADLEAEAGWASSATTTRSGGAGAGEDDEDSSPPTGGDEGPPPESPLPGPLPGPLPAPDEPATEEAPAAAAAAPPATPTLEIAVVGPDVSVEASVGDDVDVSVDVGGEESPLDVDVTLPGSGLGIP